MPRILVVDDDGETCRFMDELLSARGPADRAGPYPGRGPGLAQRGAFDLVVSDINLNAELSGLDLLRAFKRADARLEVVLISGFGTLETAIEAVRAGAFDYVSKPFDIVEVKDTVDRALKRRAQPSSSRAGGGGGGRARGRAHRPQPRHARRLQADRATARARTRPCSSRARRARARS